MRQERKLLGPALGVGQFVRRQALLCGPLGEKGKHPFVLKIRGSVAVLRYELFRGSNQCLRWFDRYEVAIFVHAARDV